jgi:hypothetical protein
VDVINYSIGGGAGAPGADELAFLFAADAGVFVATSAGNSGSGAATLGNPATMPWVTSVGASTQKRFFEGVITLGNGKKFKGASITPELGWTPLVDAADAGGEFCIPGTLNPSLVAGKIVLCLRGVVGRAEKSLAVFQAGGAGMIQYNANDVDNLFTDSHWVPSVHIDNTPGLKIKAYIDSASNPRAKFDTREDDGCPDVTWEITTMNADLARASGLTRRPWCSSPRAAPTRSPWISSSRMSQRPAFRSWLAIHHSPIRIPLLLANCSRQLQEHPCPARM